MVDRFQDFLIRVRGPQASGSYPVESEADDGGRSTSELRIDPQALLSSQLDPPAYGLALYEMLFSGPIGRAYEKAIGRAGAETEGRLRVRLWIEPQAAELHAIPWERLYHVPEGQPIPLATSARNPFSRYTGLDARDPQPVSTRPIRLLFALSNPTDLPEGLKRLEVDTEVRVLHEALGDLRRATRIRVTLLPGRTSLSPELLAELEREGYDVIGGPTTFDALTRLAGRHEIVHFVGHGSFHRDSGSVGGNAALYLEKEGGGWSVATDQDLVERVAPLEPPLPNLVFLSACDSARQEANAAHPFVGIGPKLVQAGVPAVVGMQAAVPAEVNREVVLDFYRNLFDHGIVDLALNQARLTLYHRRDVDWAIPVLFSRLREGRLFVPDKLANRVVTREGVLEETEHGAVVTRANAAPTPQRVSPPVRLLPRLPDLLGRVDEIDTAVDGLEHGQPVEFHGRSGFGKTTLLRYVSFHPPETAPDGVIYLPSRKLPVDDLLETLYEATYRTEGAYKPTPTQILQLLQNVRALVAIDDADLTREDVQRLVDSVPNAPFLLASTERNLWGEGRAIELKGLPEEVGVALFERELGRPLAEKDRAEAAALCVDLEGHPLRILQAAARVRDESISPADVRRQVGSTPPSDALGVTDLRQLSRDERKVLSVLAALDGAAIHPDHLSALTELSEAPAIVERLRRLGLVKAASPRFTMTEQPTGRVEQGLASDAWRERLLGYFIDWCDHHQDDPGALLADIEPILAALEWARSQQRFQEFLHLAQTAEEALIVGRRWGTWRWLLRQELAAADALGDEAARARALHQLGTQAIGQDAKRNAKRYLKHALRIRRSLGDKEGARVTRHNLKLLPALLLPPFITVTFMVLVVGAVTVTGASLMLSGSNGRPPALGTPPLLAAIGLRSDPIGLDFGPRLVGTTSQDTIRVSLTGGPAMIEGVIPDPVLDDFFVQTDCFGLIGEAGCTVLVSFVPRSPGPHEASVVITYNGLKSPLRIPLSGEGVP